MDESLVLCAIDLSGRPYFAWDAEFTTDRIGDMSTEMMKEFFYAISYSCGMNLHIKVLSGGNNHMWQKPCSKASPRHWTQLPPMTHGSQRTFHKGKSGIKEAYMNEKNYPCTAVREKKALPGQTSS